MTGGALVDKRPTRLGFDRVILRSCIDRIRGQEDRQTDGPVECSFN